MKIVSKPSALILIAAASLGLGCQKNSDNNPGNNLTVAAQDKDIQTKNFTSSCAKLVLTGLVTDIATGGQAPLVAQTVMYHFEGDNITRTTQVYTKTDCSNEASIALVETGTFSLNTDVRTSEDAKQMDIDYKALNMTVNDDDGVKAANAVGICGAKDWAKGQSRDVTGHAADVTCYATATPRHQSNIYYLDTSSSTLYFGTQSPDASDASKRPTKLDRNDGYVAH